MGVLIMRILAAGALALACCIPAHAADYSTVTIKEWSVPYGGHSRDPFYVSPSEVWFVGQRGHYLAALNPEDGTFRKFDLTDGAGPHNTIVSSTGMVWYTGNLRGYIGRYDPKSGADQKIAMPDPAARDPHTMVFDKDEKNIFFTVQGGNMLGRLNVATEKVDLVPVATPRSRPYGIVMDPSWTPWIVLFGTNKLASLDPATLRITEYSIPRADARPRRLAITSDGRIWYCDYATGYLGVFDPKSKAFEEWPMPSGAASRPYSIAADKHDNIWLAETGVQPNMFVGFDPKAKKFFSSTAIPSGGGTLRHMVYDAKSGQVWFGADTNHVGYAQVHAP